MLAPLAVGVLTARLVSQLVALPNDPQHFPYWWFGVLVTALAALLVTERLCRRILPLAALLRLALVFPGQAPSRWRVALHSPLPRHVRRRVEEVRAHCDDQDPAAWAEAMLSLVGALNAHDRRTRRHSERVQALTDLLARQVGVPDADRERLRWAALLHDVGKIAVSRSLLTKNARPNAYEWVQLRGHAAEGGSLVAPLRSWLGPWALAVEHHHERWDGNGYPEGLLGDEIGVAGRMVAITDAFEMMTSARPWSRPMSLGRARRELARCAGSDFDPRMVSAFLAIAPARVRMALGPLGLLGQIPLVGRLPGWAGTADPEREATIELPRPISLD